ncbi:MAG: hypothetical protein CL850_01615 [Crocinitomicaceae bacterium]|nr:hypothetical protein [Crocinitomicaceae bacterium]
MKIPSILTAILTLTIWNCKTLEVNPSVIKESKELTETPFNYDTVFVSGDTLHAVVRYSGGCGNHKFNIESIGPMLKSLPPKQPIRIVHRSDGDPCRALLKEEYKFDIKEYRGTINGTTFLILENWNKNLSYSY